MATTKKGKKTSSQKKGAKSKKKKGSASLFIKFLLVLLALAMVAAAFLFTASKFNLTNTNFNDETNKTNTKTIVKEENKNIVKPIEKVETKDEYKTQKPTENKIVETSTKPIDAKEKTTVLKNEFKEAKTMSGSWQSSEQGAFLTMDEYGYRIDFANVHASKPITGNYRIENNLIIFSSDSSDCENEDGTYRINFFKKNISLTCKSDNCVNRRNILEADWEWLEY